MTVHAAAPAPNVREAVPFLRVTDMARALRFYVDGLGFVVKQRWTPAGEIRWCLLTLGGASLMLQSLVDDDGRDLRPPTPLGLGVRVCFMCADALRIHDEAVARGLTPREPFVGNGLWVTTFEDPDGYVLDFESPTDVAEDTTLSAWRAGQPAS